MKIIGIDQSFTSCGVCVLDNKDVVTFEVINTFKTEDKLERAYQIAKRIGELYDEHQPDTIAMEGLAFGMTGNANRDLAGLQFIIAYVLRYTHGSEIKIVPPKNVKLLAIGKGKASKNEMIESLDSNVRSLIDDLGYGKKTKGLADLADAYWIARVALEKEITSPAFNNSN